MRGHFAALAPVAFVVVAACDPAIPDSAAGVGFSDPATVQAQREAALAGTTTTGQPLAPPLAVSSEPLKRAPTPNPTPVAPLPAPTSVSQPVPMAAAAAPTAAGVSTATGAPMATVASTLPPATPTTTAASASTDTAEDIANETAAALAAASQNSGVMPLQASPSNPAPTMIGNPSISDEQDFGAVSERQTIESDAARLAQNKANYQVVTPAALPARSGPSQPNIVAYALQTSHARGSRQYSRTGINLAGRNARNCAKFPSSDHAQIEFLSKGGPQKDRMALDPDGDGYACSWDPAPYRRAVTN